LRCATAKENSGRHRIEVLDRHQQEGTAGLLELAISPLALSGPLALVPQVWPQVAGGGGHFRPDGRAKKGVCRGGQPIARFVNISLLNTANITHSQFWRWRNFAARSVSAVGEVSGFALSIHSSLENQFLPIAKGARARGVVDGDGKPLTSLTSLIDPGQVGGGFELVSKR
jgi:hypothetical protein